MKTLVARRALLVAATASTVGFKSAPALAAPRTAINTPAVPTPALPTPAAPPADGWLLLESIDLNSIPLIETEYSADFAAYLARLLITWEPVTRRWWEARQAEAADFAPSAYVRPDTPFAELGAERQRFYCRAEFEALVLSVLVGLGRYTGGEGATRLVATLRARYGRSPAQKRQLAQLLSLLTLHQPTGEIAALLGEADNARVVSIDLPSPVRGFGPRPPRVVVAPPPSRLAGAKQAVARPLVEPTGEWLEVRLIDGGLGYADGEVPVVTLSQPTSAGGGGGGREARFRATVAGGRVASVQLLDAGAGYISTGGGGTVTLQVAPPAALLRDGVHEEARAARAELVAEFQLTALELLDGGAGYSADEPPLVTVSAAIDDPAGSPPSAPRPPLALRASLSERSGALTAAEVSGLERRLSRAFDGGLELPTRGPPMLLPPMLLPVRADSEAAYLLPLCVPPGAFGLPAEAPVEVQTPLTLSSAAKIFLCGAACSSTAHTVLVPIDVVKTRMQAEPGEYSNVVECTRRIVAEEGPGAFAQGGAATLVGYALAGSLSFGGVEVFGRAIRGAAGPGNTLLFATPYLVLAATCATAVCAVAICPFESVRVLSVRTGESSSAISRRYLEEGKLLQLFNGLPPLLLKEVPFVVSKFVVFESVSAALLSALPQLSLGGLTSLAAGALSGAIAAIVSQPADTIFTLASDAESVPLMLAVERVRDEPSLMLEGVGARIVFGSLLVSLQFFLYTTLRGLLDVSASDLTLVWDALAVLKQSAVEP